jgi:hypothetical protein
MISHYFPSFGHPLDMPIDEWLSLSYELRYIIPMASGHLTEELSTEMSADCDGWNGSWL